MGPYLLRCVYPGTHKQMRINEFYHRWPGSSGVQVENC
ncbi:hypothetical protein GGD55_003178 [Rhizobium giardinii]|uniref:Uncharacterized protein n=1 Tax=Rhizobium giardinii TaxID=56731 RepID=A0A7W8UBT3_9HYPH|nr:hypothetical protein [Rhizobium giardinii]